METALFDRASENDVAGVVQLLRQTDPSVDVNWRNPKADGWTCLHVSCCHGFQAVVEQLLLHPQINVNQQDNAGHTPAHLAGYHKQIGVLRILLRDSRVNVNVANDEGETPLYNASLVGNLEIVELLMASCETLDLDKKDPLGCARRMGWGSVVKLFENIKLDPERTRLFLRKSLKLNEPVAGEIFALSIFLCDNFLALKGDAGAQNAVRYFQILCKLPMDLQMILCNRTVGLATSVIRKADSEMGFKKYGRIYAKESRSTSEDSISEPI